MSTFFSSTDINTLREEGNDRNCFVSLIVNNEGTYCAAITRKVQAKHEVTIKQLGKSYQFFGEGEKRISTDDAQTTQIIDKEIIEYFMLDIEKEVVDNPLSYLDARFVEIENAKKERIFLQEKTYPSFPIPQQNSINELDIPFTSSYNKTEEISEDGTLVNFWEPDPTIIHKDVIAIITCSFITNDNIDLKQWIIKHMDKKYNEIFHGNDDAFKEWAEFIIEFTVCNYNGNNIPKELKEDFDSLYSKVAEAIWSALQDFSSFSKDNVFIDEYKKILFRYM